MGRRAVRTGGEGDTPHVLRSLAKRFTPGFSHSSNPSFLGVAL